MITLNTEKGLVRIETWDDVIQRPGFVIDLDPNTIELKAIIGSYLFKDHVKCGLSSCHQPHGRGYLVITIDGRETNIGKDCGKKHFSVDFEMMRSAYDRDYRNMERREQLESFIAQIPAYIEKIANLRTGPMGADCLHTDLQALTNRGRGVPDIAVEKIMQMARARDGRIMTQRLATNLEVENLEAIQGKEIRRPHYLDEEIGYLSGITALYPEYNLRQILVIDAGQGLALLKQLNISILSENELRTHSKWASDLDTKLSTVRQAIREARILLSPPNLSKLDALIHGKDEKRLFFKFVARLKTRLKDDTSLAA